MLQTLELTNCFMTVRFSAVALELVYHKGSKMRILIWLVYTNTVFENLHVYPIVHCFVKYCSIFKELKYIKTIRIIIPKFLKIYVLLLNYNEMESVNNFGAFFEPLMSSTVYLSTQNLHKVNIRIVCVNMNAKVVRA